MKTTGKITLALAVLLLTASAAFGDDGKKGFIAKIFDGFAESTRAVNQINRENVAAVKAESKANFKEAVKPDSGMKNFLEAKGFGGKVNAILTNFKDGAKVNSEIEKERRTKIQSHESYKAILDNQRNKE